MKTWHKVKDSEIGRTHIIWRHRAPGRFGMRILTWLLSAFVMGILTSIFVDALGRADIAQFWARIVFWIVFIGGIIIAFLRNVFFGIEYRITENAIVTPKALWGMDVIARLLGMEKVPFEKIRYVRWDEIGEIKEEKGRLELVLKDDGSSVSIGIVPVNSFILFSPEGKKESKKNSLAGLGFSTKETALDKEAMRIIRQKARERRKYFLQK